MIGHGVVEWVRQRLIESNYDAAAVREQYERFKSETSSDATKRSFGDIVSREKRNMERNPEKFHDDGSVNDPNGFTAPESPTFKHTATEGTVVEGRSETLEDADTLLEKWGIDTNKWAVETWDIKKQTVYAKDKQGKLDYSDGRIQEGTITYNGLAMYPIYHIRMRLIRKELPSDLPTLHTVQMKMGKPASRGKKSSKKNYKTALVFSDAQIGFQRDNRTGKLDPFHDRRALDLTSQIAERVQPDVVIANGDMLDLTEWSTKFVTGPEFVGTTQPALNELAWWLGDIKRAAGKGAEFHYISGNHEDRLPRLLAEYQQSLMGIRNVNTLSSLPQISIAQLLSLDELGYTWYGDYPHGHVWLGDTIRVSHSEKDRTNTKTIANQAAVLHVMAHIHRLKYDIKTIHLKDRVQYAGVVSFGGLCRIDDMVPAKGTTQDWQQGIGIIRYSETNPRDFPPIIEPVLIHDGKTIFQGEELVGEDRTKELARDINWTGFA